MDMNNTESIPALLELIVPFLFLFLSYKFLYLNNSQEHKAYIQISWGFRFLFLAYLLPIVGAFIGSHIHSDQIVKFEMYYTGLPYYLGVTIGVFFFVRAVSSFAKLKIV